MVTEIGMADVPLLEGYVGNLTEEQDAKLHQMWKEFFKCCDNAKGKGGAEGGQGNEQQQGWSDDDQDPKKSGIPKGDQAKDEAKKKEEEQAMKDLQQEYGSDALRTTFWKFVKFDNPDTTMLRFLRARKWDVGRAIAMLAGCLKWRLDNKVENLAEAGDLGNGKIEKFLEQQRSGKTYAFGTALNEQPICYIHVRKHNTFGQPGSSLQKYVIYAMESFRLLMMPPNDKVVLMFDMTGFGLKNMDWNCILFIVKCLEAYFPESLGTLYVHNAPWIFWGIWKILGPLLDPVVRSKVVFTSKGTDMEQHVPPQRLLSNLGGSTTNEFEFIEPKEGENDLLKDTKTRDELHEKFMKLAEEYEQVTKSWSEQSSTDKEAEEKRKTLVKKLRVAQFEQEPYFRGKTQCHRDGTLDGQGIVTWLYKQNDGESIRHIVGRRFCVATLKREIKDIEEGKSTKEAEDKSEEALKNNDFVTLYGDEETARILEGDRVDGKIPDEGVTPDPKAVAGPARGTAAVAAGTVSAGKADGGATGGGATTETAGDFHDAPQAAEKEAKKAVDGDEKVDENADDKGAEKDDAAAAKAKKEEEKDTKVNGDANGDAAKSNSDGPVSTIKEKASNAKTNIKEKGPNSKGETLGRRFSKLMGKSS